MIMLLLQESNWVVKRVIRMLWYSNHVKTYHCWYHSYLINTFDSVNVSENVLVQVVVPGLIAIIKSESSYDSLRSVKVY